MNKQVFYLKIYKEKLCGMLIGILLSIFTVIIFFIGVYVNVVSFDNNMWVIVLVLIFIFTPMVDIFIVIFELFSKYEKITIENETLEFFAERNKIPYGSITKLFRINKIKKIKIKNKGLFCFEYIEIELSNSKINIYLSELSYADYIIIKQFLLSHEHDFNK